MASACKSAVGCVDPQMPARATYVNLYKWPESDAEFVRSVTRGRPRAIHRKFGGPSPTVVDSYSCRQMYLRSYTFSRKESVPEMTARCFGRAKERAAVLIRESADGGNGKSSGKRRSEKTKKSCVTVRKIKEASRSAIRSIFGRLLACTSTVDVADRGTPE